MNTAERIEIGMAMRSERPVTSIVPITIPARPKEPFSGFHRVENNSSVMDVFSSKGIDLKISINNIIKKRSEMITVIVSISFVPRRSRILLLSIGINMLNFFPIDVI